MLANLLETEYLKAYKDLQVLSETLARLPLGSLYPSKKGNRIYYYHQYYAQKKRYQKYVRLADVEELRTQLSMRAELEARKKELQREIQYVTRFLKILKINVDDVRKGDQQRIQEREMLHRQKRERANAAKMDPYGNRKVCTNNGEYVRSKSEALIANLLAQNQILYAYEKPLWLGNSRFHPDFTIELDDRTFYWEHCGMMQDPQYAENWSQKRKLYAEYGIREGKNLIITYDDDDGGIDTSEIQKLIEIHLL